VPFFSEKMAMFFSKKKMPFCPDETKISLCEHSESELERPSVLHSSNFCYFEPEGTCYAGTF